MQAAVALRARGGASTVSNENSVGEFSRSKKPLYRDRPLPAGTRSIGNLLKDPRIARGGTYSSPVVAPSDLDSYDRAYLAEQERRKRLGSSARFSESQTLHSFGDDVPPVPGRVHMEIQTETYLEVLSDRPPEAEVGVQTDAKLDRPPPAIFIPQSSGVDATTQIEPGELFDFDFEVMPLLDVLVGRTLDQAISELGQELELNALRDRREEFEALRTAELMEIQRIEAEVKRRYQERQRRKEQEMARLKKENEVRQKVAAAAFARSYLSAMQRNVFSQLHQSGHFYDPLRREIEENIIPHALEQASIRLSHRESIASALVNDILRAAIELKKQRRAVYVAEMEEKRRQEAEARAAEAARLAAEMAALEEDSEEEDDDNEEELEDDDVEYD